MTLKTFDFDLKVKSFRTFIFAFLGILSMFQTLTLMTWSNVFGPFQHFSKFDIFQTFIFLDPYFCVYSHSEHLFKFDLELDPDLDLDLSRSQGHMKKFNPQ